MRFPTLLGWIISPLSGCRRRWITGLKIRRSGLIRERLERGRRCQGGSRRSDGAWRVHMMHSRHYVVYCRNGRRRNWYIRRRKYRRVSWRSSRKRRRIRREVRREFQHLWTVRCVRVRRSVHCAGGHFRFWHLVWSHCKQNYRMSSMVFTNFDIMFRNYSKTISIEKKKYWISSTKRRDFFSKSVYQSSNMCNWNNERNTK